MLKKLLQQLPYFLPLEVFLFTAWFGHQFNLAWLDWQQAFYAGTFTSFLVLVFLSCLKKKLNDFFVGTTLFLSVAAIAFLFNISLILDIYEKMQINLFFIVFAASYLILRLLEDKFDDWIEVSHGWHRKILVSYAIISLILSYITPHLFG
jgi:hypothetical protein